MLDSRYVHLHEALGLGVMWLNNGAKIINLPSQSPPHVETPLPPSSIDANPKITRNVHIVPKTNARLATLQRIQAHSTTPENHFDADRTVLMTPEPINPHLKPNPIATQNARLMVMSVCASIEDIAAQQLFSREDGVLLNKMFHAIALSPQDVLLTTWLKDLPDFNPKPPTQWVQQASHRVAQEWQNCGASAMLLLGDFFNREDVQTQLNQFSQIQQRFMIAHPLRIAHNRQLKRAAWHTLQQLQAYLSLGNPNN